MFSSVGSLLSMKCPKCHEGDIYINKNSYHLSTAGKMHQACPVCNLDYQPEPGFYFGAGYVSYAITIAISIIIFVCLYPFVDWYRWEIYVGVIFGVLLLTFPLIFRYSRVGWLYIFHKYDPQFSKKNSTE
jgi:hypothetical protein